MLMSEPFDEAIFRLVFLRGGVSLILDMIRRNAANSSGVQLANVLVRNSSDVEACSPMRSSSSAVPGEPLSGAGMSMTACALEEALILRRFSLLNSAFSSRKNDRKTLS